MRLLSFGCVKMYCEVGPLRAEVEICPSATYERKPTDTGEVSFESVMHGGRYDWRQEEEEITRPDIFFRPHLLVRNRTRCFEIAPDRLI